MIVDHTNALFHQARSKCSVIVAPLQYTVNLPISMLNWAIHDFSTHQSLVKENSKLRAESLLLNAKLQKQLATEVENRQLHALLQSASRSQEKITEAQLLSVSPDPFVKQVTINNGENRHVFVGQPVLDAGGIMGQVVAVGSLTSRVMLITDSKSAVPVQVSRNGIRAIATGDSSSDLLKLQNVTDTMDVRKGDLLITSGLGQRYPFGYPVGTVVLVKHNADERFADITVSPAAHLNRSRLVLLVWPRK